ncbi:hypothetical protein ACLOJK_033990 [Asimina triloba]
MSGIELASSQGCRYLEKRARNLLGESKYVVRIELLVANCDPFFQSLVWVRRRQATKHWLLETKSMQAVKEKVNNMAAVAREKLEIHKAKVEEKAEKKAARTELEKEAAHERRKAKEGGAKMELHIAKAQNKARREQAEHRHPHQKQPHDLVIATQAHGYPTPSVPPGAAAAIQDRVRGHDQQYYEAPDPMKVDPNPPTYPPNAKFL